MRPCFDSVRYAISFCLLLYSCGNDPSSRSAVGSPAHVPSDNTADGSSPHEHPDDAGSSESGSKDAGLEDSAAPDEAGSTSPSDAGTPPNSVCPPNRDLVWQLNFSDPNWASGAAGVEAALAALGTSVMAGAKNVAVVSDPEHGNALKLTYPARSGSIACVADKQCVTEGGLVFRAPLPEADKNVSVLLSYWVKFDKDFQWVKGGKLPGLCGGECPTGGRDVEPDRFSIRYMWRTDGTAMVYSYLTYPPNPGTGLNMGVGTWRWQADNKWHHIQEELVLNTANNRDGVIRVWYDRPISEKPNFEQKNLNYYDRTKYPDGGIDKLLFSTFHGGNDASWSPNRDVYAYFADFQLCR